LAQTTSQWEILNEYIPKSTEENASPLLSSLGKKATIKGLTPNEVEHGECTIKLLSDVRVEHNLQMLESDVIGLLVLTNYKLIFKP
jgi:hypothetical protein